MSLIKYIPKRQDDFWSSGWSEFPSLRNLQRELNRFSEDAVKTLGARALEPLGLKYPSFTPKIDVKEDKDEVVVSAECPGMDEKDIDISLKDNVLTLKGEKKTEKEEKQKDYYRMERTYGSFERVISLPSELDPNKTEASFKKGVLTVHISKTAKAKTSEKKIEIKGS